MVSYPWRVQNKFEVIFYFFVTTVYGTKKSVIDKCFLSDRGNTDSYKGKTVRSTTTKKFCKEKEWSHSIYRINSTD